MTAQQFAMAQQPAGGQEPSLFMSLLPILIIFAIIYFLMIRPQTKRQKEKEKMLEALNKGDEVMTSGGIYGTIEALKPKEGQVILKIGKDTKITVARNSISQVVGDSTGSTGSK